jgi:ribosomal protein S18 acetylase RimI-like enzyme
VLITADLVRTAYADGWQAEGHLRQSAGGTTTEVAGARLMSSGLHHPQWNSGDVHDPDAVDIEAVRTWYAGLGVPWGLRLPAGAIWPHGHRILSRGLMGLTPSEHRAASPVPGLELRPATATDVDVVLAVDSAAFGSDPDAELPWTLPHLQSSDVDTVLGLLDGVPVATGYAVRSRGLAGPAALLGGICVLPPAEGRGVGSALTSWLLERTFGQGTLVATLQPETERASAVYHRLGFGAVDGVDIYLDGPPTA